MKSRCCILTVLVAAVPGNVRAAEPVAFLEKHCTECHDATEKKGGLDLTGLALDFTNAGNFARWVKVHDRIESGEMPPKKKARPPAEEAAAVLKSLHESLVAAEKALAGDDGLTRIRRLTRGEYENTMRDLFDMPGLALAGDLPADGLAHGFDNYSDALDISHVNLAKYVEAADKTLDLAIATQPQAPTVHKSTVCRCRRIVRAAGS